MRYWLLFLLTWSLPALAQDTLRSIPVKAHYLSTDESGNAYVVRNDNVLIRYNDRGDSTGFYNSVLNGDIGSVDALNRLRVFVFYPDYSRIVWLDQTMNLQAEADLKKLGIPAGALAAPSSDNKIWVYDSYSAMLRKIDENGVVQRTSNDLRQQLDFVPQGIQLLERERKVFLVDSSRGVLVFDQFGSYLSMIPEHIHTPIDVRNNLLLYSREQKMIAYDMNDSRRYRLYDLKKSETPLMGMMAKGGLVFLLSNGLLFVKVYNDIGTDE